jgi:hypothetical protein
MPVWSSKQNALLFIIYLKEKIPFLTSLLVAILLCYFSLFCFHEKNIHLKKSTSYSMSKFGPFNQASEYQKHYKCNCVNAQNYRNWVLKVTRSLLFVSDGATISGAVSTVHCYQKHLSESSYPIQTKIYQILSEQNCMELYIFSSLSQKPRNKFIYPCIP